MPNLLEEIVKRFHQGAEQVKTLPQQFQATGQLIKQGAPQAASNAYNAYAKASPMIPFAPQIPNRQNFQQAQQRQVSVGQFLQKTPQIQGPPTLGSAAYNFGVAQPLQSYGRSLERSGQNKFLQGDIWNNIEDVTNLAFNPIAGRVVAPVLKTGGSLALQGANALGQTGKIKLGPNIQKVAPLVEGGNKYLEEARDILGKNADLELKKISTKNLDLDFLGWDKPGGLTAYDRASIDYHKNRIMSGKGIFPLLVTRYSKQDNMGKLTHQVQDGKHRLLALMELGFKGEVPVLEGRRGGTGQTLGLQNIPPPLPQPTGGGKGLDPLIEEARKYKSVDDFIRAMRSQEVYKNLKNRAIQQGPEANLNFGEIGRIGTKKTLTDEQAAKVAKSQIEPLRKLAHEKGGVNNALRAFYEEANKVGGVAQQNVSEGSYLPGNPRKIIPQSPSLPQPKSISPQAPLVEGGGKITKQERELFDTFTGNLFDRGLIKKTKEGYKTPVVYHGTDKDFTQFNTLAGEKSTRPISALGTWFTSVKENAINVVNNKNIDAKPIIKEAQISFKKPKVYNNFTELINDVENNYGKMWRTWEDGKGGLAQKATNKPVIAMRETLKKQGYDGIIIKGNIADGLPDTQYIVFDNKSLSPSLPQPTGVPKGSTVQISGQKIVPQLNPQSIDGFLPGERPGLPQPAIEAPQIPQPQSPTLPGTSQTARSFDNIISRESTDVKQKVNLLDYFRTPDRVFKKIGLENEYNAVRKQYDKYVKELPEEINKVTEWSKRVSPDANQRIFKYLDGQKVVLQDEELKVANEIKTYLAEWADKLKLPKQGRITNYITHIFDKDFIKKEFDEDLAKLIQDKIPGSVYDPFTLQRLGKLGYKEDTWQALDAYVKRGVRKYNMDPALERVKAAADKLELSQFNYVKSRIERINLRPTQIDNLVDNFIKSTPIGYKLGGRPIMALTRNARQMVYRATLGLNPGTALKNLTQGVNTYSRLGEKYTLIGYTKAAKAIATGSKELEDVGVLKGDFIEDRALNATKKAVEKMDKGLFFFFEGAEKINRGAAYFGAKAKGLSKGMSEEQAIEYAKKIVRDTQFTFGSIDTPAVLSSDLTKTGFQFGSYALKQSEFLGEMVKNKDIAGMIRWSVGSVVMLNTIGKLLGMEPKDLIPGYRFGVPPTLQLPTEIGKAALNTPDKYGNERDLGQKMGDIGKAALLYVPASTQIKKTIEGLGAYQQGASITPSGKTRFEVEQTPGNLAKAATLGQYSLPGAKEYFDNMGKSQSQIIYEQFKKLKTPEEKKALWQQMIKEKKITKNNVSDIKRHFSDEKLGITAKEQKIRKLGVEDQSRATAVVKEFKKLKTKEEKVALWQKYIKAKIITPQVAKQIRLLLQKQ